MKNIIYYYVFGIKYGLTLQNSCMPEKQKAIKMFINALHCEVLFLFVQILECLYDYSLHPEGL